MISTDFPTWLTEWMAANEISPWGAADLKDFSVPSDKTGNKFGVAISFAIPVNPQVMSSIQTGPNQAYANEYSRVNNLINTLSDKLAQKINQMGFQAQALAASVRTDTVNIKGDFPHKTAATRAGIGWIGRHCQLVTRPFGSWVRLGTVFCNIKLPCGPPMKKSRCGNCMRCVEACPANALKGAKWYPGLSREKILDVQACDKWKKEHYYQYHKGHNCGICSAVCPYGLKTISTRGRELTSS